MVKTRSTGRIGKRHYCQLEDDAAPASVSKRGRPARRQECPPACDKENPATDPTSTSQAAACPQSPCPAPVKCRVAEEAQLLSSVQASLVSKQGCSIYIPGQPGTGKTHTVKQVLRRLADRHQHVPAPAVAFVTCQDAQPAALGRAIVAELLCSAGHVQTEVGALCAFDSKPVFSAACSLSQALQRLLQRGL